MRNISSLSEEELELLIERKILEILGDPDSGLELRKEFKEKLGDRLKDPASISHEKLMRRFSED